MGAGRPPQLVQSGTRATEDDVLRGLRLCLFRCAMATIFFVAIAIAAPAQERPPSTGEQEEIPVRAGEPLNFEVHLDKAPTSSDGKIMFVTSPLFNRYAGTSGAPEFCALTDPRKLVYYCEVKTRKDAVVGTLHAEIESVWIQYPDKISTPIKFKRISFVIQGAPPLPVVTEGIEVTVDPSRAQLLRLEGIKLQRRISDLKAAVVELEQSKAGADSLAKLLRSNVRDAVVALQDTERDFEKLSTEKEIPVSRVFFGDLRISYESVLVQISDSPHRAGFTVLPFRLVSQNDQDARPKYPLVAQATFRAFEQNQLAYKVVADSGSLTFDLDVRSTPRGATILYFRRGDKPRKHQDPTNSIIPSLPLAIWMVRFEKEGYRAEEREHNPLTEPNHVVDVELKP